MNLTLDDFKIVKIDSLSFDPKNARVHNKHNLESIKESLVAEGQMKNIVVQKKSNGQMIIRAENGTVTAAKELGWKDIIAKIVETDDDKAAVRYAIRDNKTATLGDWDYEILSEYLKEFETDGLDLGSLGFEKHELDVLLHADFSPPAIPEQGGSQVINELVLRVTGESVEVVRQALQKCKQQLEGQDVPTGRLVELICAEFLSNS